MTAGGWSRRRLRSRNDAFAGRTAAGPLHDDGGRRRGRLPAGRGGPGDRPMASWCSRTAPRSTRPGYGAVGAALGELVFTTSMTGYQESVTDPVRGADDHLHAADDRQLRGGGRRPESDAPGARGDLPRGPNAAPAGREGLLDWLAEHGVVGHQGLDTRMLTAAARWRRRARPPSAPTARGEPSCWSGSRPAADGRPGAGRRRLRRLPGELAATAPSAPTWPCSTTASRGRSAHPARVRRPRDACCPGTPPRTRCGGRARRRAAGQRPRRPGGAAGLASPRCASWSERAGVRHLPRPPAAGPGAGAGDLQAAVRPSGANHPVLELDRAGCW